MGIKYLYQPAFFQQGGIYSSEVLSAAIINDFINKASSVFKFAEITLNHGNNVRELHNDFQVKTRNNFIVNLTPPYQPDAYDAYLSKRIRRAEKHDLLYEKTNDFSGIIKLYKKLYADKIGGFDSKDYKNFEALCEVMHKKKRVVVRAVYSSQDKELLAAVILLKNKQRIYNMVSVLTEHGKKKLANYFLYDRIIREFSGKDLLLDLEGSDVKGIAYFYEKFASENQTYAFVKWNRLPKIVRMVKS